MARGENTAGHPSRLVGRERFPDFSVGPVGYRGRSWNDFQGPVQSTSRHYPGLTPEHAASLDATGERVFRSTGNEHAPSEIYVPGGHIRRK